MEKNFNLKEAMESAKDSYLEDMKAGYKILHIDPSIDIHGKPDTNEILNSIKDTRLKIFRNEENLGLTKCLNIVN